MLQLTRWHGRMQFKPMILIGIAVVLLLALPGCGGGGETSSGYYNDSGSQNAGTDSQVANVANLNNPGEPIRQGDWCQITGSGFGETQIGASSNGYVLFSFENGTKGQADLYQQWTDTQIICRIPTGVKRSTAARVAIKITVVHHDSQEFENAYGSIQITYDSTPNPSPEATPPSPIPSPTSTTPAPTPTSTEPSPTQTTSTPTPTQTSSGGGGGGPTTGSIAVTVQDAGGDAVADAVLTCSSVKGYQAKVDEFKTDAEGKCTIGNLAPGTYNVTATKIGYTTTESDDVTVAASYTPVAKTITLNPAVLASIAVTPADPLVQNGSDKQFTATGTKTDGTTQDITTTVTWNSSDVAKATISNTDGSRGLAHGAGVGTTKITAQSGLITSPEVTLTVNPADGAQKWSVSAGGGIYTCHPAIGNDGTVYIGTESDNKVHAINPADGTEKWSINVGSAVHSSPAIGPDGTVYVCANNDNLYALDPADGSIKWTYNKGGSGPPAIGSDGFVYVSGTECKVYAINPASPATPAWSCAITTTGFITSGPVIASDGTVYVRDNYAHLIAIKYNNTTHVAAEQWIYNLDSGGTGWKGSPAIADDGTIYVQTGYKLYSIKSNGSKNWIYDGVGVGSDGASPAIGSDGTVYVGAGDYLYAITPGATAGTLKWQYDAADSFSSDPSVASDGRIYFGAGGYVHAVSSAGAMLWKKQITLNRTRDHVIGSDGTIYVGESGGGFFALYGSFTLANTPWPMFNKNIRHTGCK